MIWVAEKKARGLFSRLRYSEQESTNNKCMIQPHQDSKRTFETNVAESRFFAYFSHFILLVGVVTGIRWKIWVAENEAPELFSRLRYSEQESHTGKYTIHLQQYSEKTLDSAEIGLDLRLSPFKRPKKISGQVELYLNFIANKFLKESIDGARRTVVRNALGLVGGGT